MDLLCFELEIKQPQGLEKEVEFFKKFKNKKQSSKTVF